VDIPPLGYAVIASVLFGIYLLPVKLLVVNERSLLVLASGGLGATAVCLLSLAPAVLSSPALVPLLIAGFVWALGNYLSLFAVRALGVTQAVALFAVAGAVNAAWGIGVFAEISAPGDLAIAALGTFGVVGGVMIVLGGVPRPDDRRGLVLALLTAACFGSYNAPLKVAHAPPLEVAAGLVLGAAIGSALLALPSLGGLGPVHLPERWGERGLGTLGGGLWALGAAASVVAIQGLGLSRAFPIFMANVLIYVALGLGVFKERYTTPPWQMLVGALVVVASASLITQAS